MAGSSKFWVKGILLMLFRFKLRALWSVNCFFHLIFITKLILFWHLFCVVSCVHVFILSCAYVCMCVLERERERERDFAIYFSLHFDISSEDILTCVKHISPKSTQLTCNRIQVRPTHTKTHTVSWNGFICQCWEVYRYSDYLQNSTIQYSTVETS